MKTEQILNVAEVAKAYGISEHLVRQYIEAGTLRAWQDGKSGRGHAWHIPASAAEAVLGVYRGALTTDEAAKRAGMTSGGILQAIDAGTLERIAPPQIAGVKAFRVYVTPEAFDAWMASRHRQPAKTAANEARVNGHAPEERPLPFPPASVTARMKATGFIEGGSEDLAVAVRELRAEVKALAQAIVEHDRRNVQNHEAMAVGLEAMGKAIEGLATWVGLAVDKADAQARPAAETVIPS